MGCGCSSAAKVEGELADIPDKAPKENAKTHSTVHMVDQQ